MDGLLRTRTVATPTRPPNVARSVLSWRSRAPRRCPSAPPRSSRFSLFAAPQAPARSDGDPAAELTKGSPGQLGGGRTKIRGTVDVAMLQTLARRDDIPILTADYGLVVVDECHHVPAAGFAHAVKQIPARRWLGLTATPYRRDQLDDLIGLQLGPTRHTMTTALPGTLPTRADQAPPPQPVLHVHPTAYRYSGDGNPSAPGGIAAIYRDLTADDARTRQVCEDVRAALEQGRHCLVLTQWTTHLDRLADALREHGYDPVVLRGGMGAKARTAALTRLQPGAAGPLLVVATGPYIGEGFDCPALDTLFLAAPIAFKGRLVQYAGRILSPYPGKTTAEVHDYHDILTGVLASSLTRRAPGYTSLGFPDPRTLRGIAPRIRVVAGGNVSPR